jgi:hypothetical protein
MFFSRYTGGGCPGELYHLILLYFLQTSAGPHGASVDVRDFITPFGIWLFVQEKEYFLSYKDYPYFKDERLSSIQNVQLLHGYHLYWPELDVDLEIDNLENPQKYPLKSRATKKPPAIHSMGRRIASR